MSQVIVQDNYIVAIELAKEKFKNQDPGKQAKRCGGRVIELSEANAGKTEIEIKYFDKFCIITHPEGKITIKGNEAEIPQWEQILILHYLTSTGVIPPQKENLAFCQIPGASFYNQAFERRIKNHFLSTFADNSELLIKSALSLGGDIYNSNADAGVVLKAFPKIELYFLLWKSDDEFPADMNLLMTSNIDSFLSIEDIAVLGSVATGKLVHQAKQLTK